MTDRKLDRWKALADKGFVVLIALGPYGSMGVQFSVMVLAPNGEMFDMPFLANNFEHAIEIAEIEIDERNW